MQSIFMNGGSMFIFIFYVILLYGVYEEKQAFSMCSVCIQCLQSGYLSENDPIC